MMSKEYRYLIVIITVKYVEVYFSKLFTRNSLFNQDAAKTQRSEQR